MTLAIVFKTNVGNCARCQKDHVDVEFKPIDNFKFASHFAICPTNGQPIMMNMSKDKKRKARKTELEPRGQPLKPSGWPIPKRSPRAMR